MHDLSLPKALTTTGLGILPSTTWVPRYLPCARWGKLINKKYLIRNRPSYCGDSIATRTRVSDNYLKSIPLVLFHKYHNGRVWTGKQAFSLQTEPTANVLKPAKKDSLKGMCTERNFGGTPSTTSFNSSTAIHSPWVDFCNPLSFLYSMFLGSASILWFLPDSQ